MSRYAVGVDFGTESARTVLVDVGDGGVRATAVHPYSHGVIDDVLPINESRVVLSPEWALQDPEDYLRVFETTIPDVLRTSGVKPADVIGVGIDFTACTMLPTTAFGTPLCLVPDLRSEPHAWVKLWKHHAAQGQADRINEVARATGQEWLVRYGGKISSEWFFAKSLQILEEAPHVYARAERLIEAADWVVWQLTGEERRASARPATRRCGRSTMGSRQTSSSPHSIRRSRMSLTRACHAICTNSASARAACPSGLPP